LGLEEFENPFALLARGSSERTNNNKGGTNIKADGTSGRRGEGEERLGGISVPLRGRKDAGILIQKTEKVKNVRPGERGV